VGTSSNSSINDAVHVLVAPSQQPSGIRVATVATIVIDLVAMDHGAGKRRLMLWQPHQIVGSNNSSSSSAAHVLVALSQRPSGIRATAAMIVINLVAMDHGAGKRRLMLWQPHQIVGISSSSSSSSSSSGAVPVLVAPSRQLSGTRATVAKYVRNSEATDHGAKKR